MIQAPQARPAIQALPADVLRHHTFPSRPLIKVPLPPTEVPATSSDQICQCARIEPPITQSKLRSRATLPPARIWLPRHQKTVAESGAQTFAGSPVPPQGCKPPHRPLWQPPFGSASLAQSAGPEVGSIH